MHRIGIFAQGGKEWAGGAELTRNLVVSAQSHAADNGIELSFTLIGDKASFDSATAGLDDFTNVEWVPYPTQKFSLVSRIRNRLWPTISYANIERLVKAQQLDFLYPVVASKQDVGCRGAAWIYDFQHVHLPHHFSTEELKLRTADFDHIAEKSQYVVLSSLNAKADFDTIYSSYSDKGIALPFRVNINKSYLEDSPRDFASSFNLPEKFLIVCNQFWTHKNHNLVIDAVAHCRQQHPEILVVFTGRMADYRMPNHVDQVIQKIHRHGLHRNFVILGMVSKREQLALIRASHAVVQPSLFEGWSTIVEECHALGKQLIVSDLAVHREQDVPYAEYFSPGCSDDLAAKLVEVWNASSTVNFSTDYQSKVKEFGREFCRLAGVGGAEKRSSVENLI